MVLLSDLQQNRPAKQKPKETETRNSHLDVARHHGTFLLHRVHDVEQVAGSGALLAQVDRLRYSAGEVDQRVARVTASADVLIAAAQPTR